MTSKKKALAVVALTAVLSAGGLGLAAFAAENQGGDAQEQAAIASAKITMQQAISIAEQSAGGKSTGSGIESQDGTAIYYDVTVDKGGTPQKVLVDMQTGKVVSVVAENGTEGAEGAEGTEANDGNEANEGPETNEQNEGQGSQGNGKQG